MILIILFQKYNLWENRVLRDIPTNDYLSMKNKLGVPVDDKIRSQVLIKNWILLNSSFRDLETLTEIQQEDSTSRITCSAISGKQ